MTAVDRVEWTVAADEQATLIRASVTQLWRKVALKIVLLLVGVGALYGASRWGLPGLLLGPVAGAAWGALFWWVVRRSVRRILLAAYPIGATATAEAGPQGLRLGSVAGASELPWARLTRAEVGPVVVLVKDAVSRQWMALPRRLLRDEWLPRFGTGAPS